MTEDVNVNGNAKAKATDDNLLLVSGSKGSKGSDKDYVKKLSNAVLQVYAKHSSVKMRCVGAASVNNAMKALIIASGEAQKNGDNLMFSPSFTTVNFNGEEKTGIVIDVISIDD